MFSVRERQNFPLHSALEKLLISTHFMFAFNKQTEPAGYKFQLSSVVSFFRRRKNYLHPRWILSEHWRASSQKYKIQGQFIS